MAGNEAPGAEPEAAETAEPDVSRSEELSRLEEEANAAEAAHEAQTDATHLARSSYGTSGNRRENVARGRSIGILPDILSLFTLDDVTTGWTRSTGA